MTRSLPRAGVVVVSNRGPFSFKVSEDGSLVANPGGGGLAPSLAAALASTAGSTWVAAAMSEGDRRAAAAGVVDTAQPGLSLRLVAMEAEEYRAAYDVIANATLWFVLHGLYDASRRPIFDSTWFQAWESFRAYNSAFASAAVEVAAEDAVVLVNDYHLPLLGSMLKAARPDLRTVHFAHTPFSWPDELGMLPRSIRDELMRGLAGYGACGFHSARWESAFRCSAEAQAVGVPATFHAPLGPDIERLREVAASAECASRLEALEARLAGRRLLLRSDRVELSKNLLRGLLAFGHLLEVRPELRGEVVHVARAYASREGLPEYLAYRSEVEHLASVLNERWGLPGYEPVVIDVDDDFPGTVAALRRYDVLLVNPIRDGMNLVAKEGPVLNEHDGTLVLSERAGAFDELEPEVFGVNPFDVSATAEALGRALDLPAPERAVKARKLSDLAAANPPAVWLQTVLSEAKRPV